ncbi:MULTISPECIES: Fic family protein [unclassified Nocardiopsis]|uniref:Fic family protein n=1 Tax=unclassified Nocardiopsis TaxID=2649073 RepID=UPI0009FAEC43|nr:Fic family protein [Nocardiopsis sp. TSRI0078]
MSTDHLRIWLTIRDTVPWERTRAVDSSPVVPARDGAAHDIRAFDGARSPERAAGMLAALARARADAASGAPLTFDLLSSWQRSVLDVPDAPFRGAPAFAKQGRERYGTGPDLRGLLDTCLVQSGGLDPALPARAARAYLDVCFFHPFTDGNARSAFLALSFVLARAGIALDQVGPLRRLPRHANHPEGALALADLVAVLIEHTRRRAGEHRCVPGG